MVDNVDRLTRSRMMGGIRGTNTDPELRIRRGLHRAGYRYRLHAPDLPGKPDIVLPKYTAVIFIHGCFWHRHAGCKYATVPATRADFWANKFAHTVVRDAAAEEALREKGWRVAKVWECSIRSDTQAAVDDLGRWLKSHDHTLEL